MEKVLEISNLSIGYHSAIHKDINLDLYKGQLICIIGPNGIGKSTFLKTISKVIPPISGKILIEDNFIQNLSNYETSKLISLVLTDYIDGFNLKALDVIQMGRYPHTGFWGSLKKDDLEIIEKVVSEIGIENLLHRSFSELSDGEKQKVMIAKALVQEAPLMLLDEPTAFLDFPTKASLLILLRNLAKTNQIGIILSTHDIELALKTADQILLFTEDHQLIKGMPEDLVLEGHINQVFKSKEMEFNPLSGHFERIEKHQKSVQVKGNSNAMFWLKMALKRNEIGIDNDSEIMIQFQDKYTISTLSKKLSSHSKIEEVICELNKIL